MLKRTRENPSTVTPSTSTKMNDLNDELDAEEDERERADGESVMLSTTMKMRKTVMQNKVEMARKGMAFPFSSLCFPFTSARSFITLAGAAPPGLCQRLVLLIFFCTSSPTKGYSWLIKSRLSSSLPPLLSSFHYEAKPDPNSLPPIEGFPITESEVRWAETKAKIRRLWS
ncbi:hypothetical protein RHMOL_Rhmol06G0151400 [Rhododendron molle]|uniref:Uncharacterized protein n=1 Tax=Rhododendron molle TaxID=49168 RepID=A0ACC0ND51_RHOML|nr:hypothetical protein RHMOL_Rhmol06G0151400 [Rhododendron molle]